MHNVRRSSQMRNKTNWMCSQRSVRFSVQSLFGSSSERMRNTLITNWSIGGYIICVLHYALPFHMAGICKWKRSLKAATTPPVWSLKLKCVKMSPGFWENKRPNLLPFFSEYCLFPKITIACRWFKTLPFDLICLMSPGVFLICFLNLCNQCELCFSGLASSAAEPALFAGACRERWLFPDTMIASLVAPTVIVILQQDCVLRFLIKRRAVLWMGDACNPVSSVDLMPGNQTT